MAKGAPHKTKRNPIKKTREQPAAKPAKPEPQSNGAPIVAIGASAGGLEAIIILLENLPAHTGASFVILQHFAPDHETMLPNILEKKHR